LGIATFNENQKTERKMTDEHQRLILDQFTKQAVPFSQMQNHSPELLLAASKVGPADNVLDVACGPGLMACAFAKVARHVIKFFLSVNGVWLTESVPANFLTRM
jgi:ubiquinone/menaquinone biosynthesis C-methylase UbiE